MFWRVFWLRSTCLKVDCKEEKPPALAGFSI